MPTITLFNDHGMETGETFHSWLEVFEWVEETTGEPVDDSTQSDIQNGYHFSVGKRYYKCIPDSVLETAAA